ncbi:hypothetical protein M404DRAFT_1004652 [Pisolithus tinctorius Marx 270]|uniref:Uncharacterized protein n=1 Tax=Pisolithus tinctorius Marx 270 TaxID=870435 RepID=A0A0C3IRL1_PISTI|nr:hypothetical protein M404DRAFT_1004652 [Pisolithus tinctorius Marx 270]
MMMYHAVSMKGPGIWTVHEIVQDAKQIRLHVKEEQTSTASDERTIHPRILKVDRA